MLDPLRSGVELWAGPWGLTGNELINVFLSNLKNGNNTYTMK